jgi:hypothetical protein
MKRKRVMDDIDSEELLTMMGVDATAWAQEFCKRFGIYKLNEIDPDNSDQFGTMLMWFTRAIGAGRRDTNVLGTS